MSSKDNPVHLKPKYVNCLHLPELKDRLRRKRALYLLISTKQQPEPFKHEIYPLGESPPIAFFTNTYDSLEVVMYAKRLILGDILLGRGDVSLESLAGGGEHRVIIRRTERSRLMDDPVVVFEFDKSDTFVRDQEKNEQMKQALVVNPMLEKFIGGVEFLVEIGSVIAEINPIAQAVMGISKVLVSECRDFVNRHATLTKLLGDVTDASMMIQRWDDRTFDNFRKHQINACRDLFPVIYQCLYLVFTLSRRAFCMMLLVCFITCAYGESSFRLIRSHRF
ncbi:hypothetical protein HGRIS_012155 [Hohenbuehelia grisea]|uniref:Uncharacterized protein n=1 Tax=Hohenbuehelia grisea TaxID=104357 RepID=A0ABR3IRE1_9AGAR